MQTRPAFFKSAVLAAACVAALGATGHAGAVAVGAASQAAAATFSVDARLNSIAFQTQDAAPLNTGIFFTAGAPLQITASGLWGGDTGRAGLVGPDGDTKDTYGLSPYGFHYYALVGKFGVAGNYFLVGSSFNGVASQAGNLYLGFLDTNSSDNSGFVMANVSAVPEPASWALMLGGGAVAIGALRRRRG